MRKAKTWNAFFLKLPNAWIFRHKRFYDFGVKKSNFTFNRLWLDQKYADLFSIKLGCTLLLNVHLPRENAQCNFEISMGNDYCNFGISHTFMSFITWSLRRVFIGYRHVGYKWMLVTFFGCWWYFLDVGDIFWMLVIFFGCRWCKKDVGNILKALVDNSIGHQHS